jgi:hypothetical protein
MLTRDERSFGSIEHDSRHSAVDGCDLFEGDPKSPQMCRGWFQCSDPHVAARSGSDLLHLILSKRIAAPIASRMSGNGMLLVASRSGNSGPSSSRAVAR